MSFEHRKYHGLYFILGFIIAAMLVMLLGCKPAETDSGIIDYPPPPPPEFCENGTMEWDEVEEDWICKMVIID